MKMCSKFSKQLIVAFILANILVPGKALDDDETVARNVIKKLNENLATILNKQTISEYKFEISSQPEEIENMVNAENELTEFMKYTRTELPKIDLNLIQDEDLKRQIKHFPKKPALALTDEDYESYNEAISNMQEIYLSVQMCSYKDQKNCNSTLIPEVQDILHSSNDIDEILYYWIEFRKQTGRKVDTSFDTFTKLYRKTAKLNNYSKPSQLWFETFEEDNMLGELERIMGQLRPLYEQFHAHIRYLLRQKYGEDLIRPSYPYPLHVAEILLGDAHKYEDGAHIDFPYPEAILPNITANLMGKGFNPKKMFDVADEFFSSLGFPKLSEAFWSTSAVPIEDKDQIFCLTRGWDFHVDENVGFTYCDNVDYRHYLNMFSALSDVQYFKQFQHQPTVFRNEAFDNFKDALGGVMELSASSPKYMEKLGLLDGVVFDDKLRMNRLYLKGMQEIFLLPILFVLDKFRVHVLDKDISDGNNCAYWDMTEKYTGGMPPIKRSNDIFDAPAKLLIGVDSEYSSLVVGTIIQFQVYKHFCEKIDQYIPGNPEHTLDNCDLTGHPELGDILKQAMSLGSSKHWRNVLEILTGSSKLDTSGFLEYFEPLRIWLENDNLDNNVEVGWIESKQCT